MGGRLQLLAFPASFRRGGTDRSIWKTTCALIVHDCDLLIRGLYVQVRSRPTADRVKRWFPNRGAQKRFPSRGEGHQPLVNPAGGAANEAPGCL
jgi:hypothetical protein